MKILITNDDGIEAEGLHALHQSLSQWIAVSADANNEWCEAEVVVVAPDRGRSECSHSISSGRSLKVDEVRSGWFSVDGTPVDCVRVALDAIAKDTDIVLSGVNAGANLGADLLVSGTFAAAKEAALAGRSAMAVSHYRHPDVPRTWDHVPSWLNEILRMFFEAGSRPRSTKPGLGQLWNVNLPAILPQTGSTPEIAICPVDQNLMTRQGSIQEDNVSFTSDFHGRPRDAGDDVDQCFGGRITISQIRPTIG